MRQPAVVRSHHLGDRALEEVRVADEGGDEAAARRLVDLGRGPELLDLPAVHHRDPVGQAHRLALVVRDVDEGDPDLVVDQVQLDQHLLAQLEVERRQRLVEQQHVRLVDQRAGDRHPLLLAAADLVGALAGLVLHLDQRQHPVDLALDRRLVGPRDLQPEGDVLAHRQVREEGVALEDRVDLALVGRQVGDVLAVEQDPPLVGLLEPGQDPQQRRLAAARGAEQREELPAPDRQRHPVHGADLAEVLVDVLELEELGHSGRSQRSTAAGPPRQAGV